MLDSACHIPGNTCQMFSASNLFENNFINMLVRVRLPQLDFLSKTLMIAKYVGETFKTMLAV